MMLKGFVGTPLRYRARPDTPGYGSWVPEYDNAVVNTDTLRCRTKELFTRDTAGRGNLLHSISRTKPLYVAITLSFSTETPSFNVVHVSGP
jgi:hypothetical protein